MPRSCVYLSFCNNNKVQNNTWWLINEVTETGKSNKNKDIHFLLQYESEGDSFWLRVGERVCYCSLGASIGLRLSWFAQWDYGSFFDDIELFEVGNLMALTRAFVAYDHCRMHIPWSFLAKEQLGCSFWVIIHLVCNRRKLDLCGFSSVFSSNSKNIPNNNDVRMI